MILGTQWYILFNVIAGATAFPTDLREAATEFPRAWLAMVAGGSRCRRCSPIYVTGAITASGGAWNASIVAEAATGARHLDGRRPRRLYRAGHGGRRYPRTVLGIAVMALFVVLFNRLLLAAALRLCRAKFRLSSMRKLHETPATIDQRSARCRCSNVRGVLQGFPQAGRRRARRARGCRPDTRGAGEIVGLLGRSGSGQVDLAAAHRGPRSRRRGGEVNYRGKPVTGPARRHRHGVPELRALPLAHRAQNVKLGLEALGCRRRRSASARWRPSTSSASTVSSPPIRASSRAACASASDSPARWSCNPSILLMDEPFSALDVLTAETLRTDFLDLWGEGQLPIKLGAARDPQHRGGGADVRPPAHLLDPSRAGRQRDSGRSPHPRSRLDPRFRALVERVYVEMTARRAATAVGPRRSVRRAPASARRSSMSPRTCCGPDRSGDAPPYNGQADLPAIAEELQHGGRRSLPVGRGPADAAASPRWRAATSG